MMATHLKAKLETLHKDSFAWAVHCCYKDSLMAAEVLQQSYLKILEGKARFNNKSTFKTWLFAIIRYTAIDYYKQTQKPKIVSIDHQELPVSPSKEEIPSVIFQQGLSQLSTNQHRILHLVFYQNLTIQEAATVMEIQLGTARTHYKRGKLRLKKWLIEAGFSINGKFIIPF